MPGFERWRKQLLTMGPGPGSGAFTPSYWAAKFCWTEEDRFQIIIQVLNCCSNVVKLSFLCLRDTDGRLISLVSFGFGWDQTKKSKLKCLSSSLTFRQMCVHINSSQFWKHWQSTYSSKTRGTRGAGGTRESGFAIFSIWARRTLSERTMER